MWSRQTVWHILQNPVYQGTAAYGKTHMTPRTKKSRPRPPRGRSAEPRRSNSPTAVDPEQWVFMSTPPIIDKALFSAAQQQLKENRARARLGLRRLGHLLQGLTCCALCGYAYYGKTTRQRARGINSGIFVTIGAQELTATGLEVSAYATTLKSRLSRWKRRYGSTYARLRITRKA
jgi:hypothetical protein